MIPPEIVDKAVEAGWEPFKTIKVASGKLKQTDYQTLSLINALTGRSLAHINIFLVLLSNSFWMALGKAYDWGDSDTFVNPDGTKAPEWYFKAIGCADLVIRGAGVEDFWREILGGSKDLADNK